MADKTIEALRLEAARLALAEWIPQAASRPQPTDYCTATTVEQWVRAVEKKPALMHEKDDANVLIARALVAAGLAKWVGPPEDEWFGDDDVTHAHFEAVFTHYIPKAASEWLSGLGT